MKPANEGAFSGGSGECRLLAGDILFVHTRRSLWGWLIRRGTHCYWNHCLMVCSPADGEHGFGSELIVDAKTTGSIVLGRVSEYSCRPDKYDIAVKRLEARWFQNDGHYSALDFRGHVCNIAVNEVEFKLGSTFLEWLDRLIRQATIIIRFVRRKLRKVSVPLSLPWNIRPIEVKAFTCGGFVQWCYYRGVALAMESQRTDQTRLKEVIFNPRAKKDPNPFELLTTTPADLANCEGLSWKYIIKNGIICEVSGDESAGLSVQPA